MVFLTCHLNVGIRLLSVGKLLFTSLTKHTYTISWKWFTFSSTGEHCKRLHNCTQNVSYFSLCSCMLNWSEINLLFYPLACYFVWTYACTFPGAKLHQSYFVSLQAFIRTCFALFSMSPFEHTFIYAQSVSCSSHLFKI